MLISDPRANKTSTLYFHFIKKTWDPRIYSNVTSQCRTGRWNQITRLPLQGFVMWSADAWHKSYTLIIFKILLWYGSSIIMHCRNSHVWIVVNCHQLCLGKLVSVYKFVASIIRICVEKCLSSALLKVDVYIYVHFHTLELRIHLNYMFGHLSLRNIWLNSIYRMLKSDQNDSMSYVTVSASCLPQSSSAWRANSLCSTHKWQYVQNHWWCSVLFKYFNMWLRKSGYVRYLYESYNRYHAQRGPQLIKTRASYGR